MRTHLYGRFGMILFCGLALLVARPAAAQSELRSAPAGPSCDAPEVPPPLEHGVFSVTLNNATTWQPRGGEVLVEIRGAAPHKLDGLTLYACFAWSRALPGAPNRSAMLRLRPSDDPTLVNLGVFVPDLPDASGWFGRLWHGDPDYTAAGMVPLAAMRLVGSNSAGDQFDIVLPVGVTSTWAGLCAAIAFVALALFALHRLTRHRAAPGIGLVLRLVTGRNGGASVSQMQVLVWTFTIGASAIYVMSLSGHLINMTNGTLILLGIAGGSGLLTSLQASRTATDPATPICMATPRWSDLILSPDQPGVIDVMRIQMLFFTVLTAGFVLLKVLNSYVVPDIPDGYLLLMGVSNGLYLGGKIAIPRTPAATAADTPPLSLAPAPPLPAQA